MGALVIPGQGSVALGSDGRCSILSPECRPRKVPSRAQHHPAQHRTGGRPRCPPYRSDRGSCWRRRSYEMFLCWMVWRWSPIPGTAVIVGFVRRSPLTRKPYLHSVPVFWAPRFQCLFSVDDLPPGFVHWPFVDHMKWSPASGGGGLSAANSASAKSIALSKDCMQSS